MLFLSVAKTSKLKQKTHKFELKKSYFPMFLLRIDVTAGEEFWSKHFTLEQFTFLCCLSVMHLCAKVSTGYCVMFDSTDSEEAGI